MSRVGSAANVDGLSPSTRKLLRKPSLNNVARSSGPRHSKLLNRAINHAAEVMRRPRIEWQHRTDRARCRTVAGRRHIGDLLSVRRHLNAAEGKVRWARGSFPFFRPPTEKRVELLSAAIVGGPIGRDYREPAVIGEPVEIGNLPGAAG